MQIVEHQHFLMFNRVLDVTVSDQNWPDITRTQNTSAVEAEDFICMVENYHRLSTHRGWLSISDPIDDRHSTLSVLTHIFRYTGEKYAVPSNVVGLSECSYCGRFTPVLQSESIISTCLLMSLLSNDYTLLEHVALLASNVLRPWDNSGMW